MSTILDKVHPETLESIRPYANRINADVEIERVLPVFGRTWQVLPRQFAVPLSLADTHVPVYGPRGVKLRELSVKERRLNLAAKLAIAIRRSSLKG